MAISTTEWTRWGNRFKVIGDLGIMLEWQMNPANGNLSIRIMLNFNNSATLTLTNNSARITCTINGIEKRQDFNGNRNGMNQTYVPIEQPFVFTRAEYGGDLLSAINVNGQYGRSSGTMTLQGETISGTVGGTNSLTVPHNFVSANNQFITYNGNLLRR
jgi:hypothetical protein